MSRLIRLFESPDFSQAVSLLNQLPPELLSDLCYDVCRRLLDDKSAAPRMSVLRERLEGKGIKVDDSACGRIIDLVTTILRSSIEAQYSTKELVAMLKSRTALAPSHVAVFRLTWNDQGKSLVETAGARSVETRKFVKMDWKVGVAAAASFAADVCHPYVAVVIHSVDSQGRPEARSFELSVPEFKKVKALTRDETEYTRERSNDIFKVQRNLNPNLHPFERAREYTRALNSTKLERVFAKPFVGALAGHVDGVYCMAKDPNKLNFLASGAGDGELRIWTLSNKQTKWSTTAHKGFVKGICVSPLDPVLVTVGVDKTVKFWHQEQENTKNIQPISTYLGKNAFNSVDHHFASRTFATAGSVVEVWDEERSEPINTFSWGSDTVSSIRFNRTETSIFATTGNDRGLVLFDLRTSLPVRKMIMTMKGNAIAWNPMEAYNFVVASEDHNCYMYDMRRLDIALNVFKDHVSAVLDVDFAPTGEEIVTGAYDRSLRIFKTNAGHSRDIYHGKRMQRIFCVQYSMDNNFVLSGSDDGNIRLWKARASEKLGTLSSREKTAAEYSETLKEKFGHMPEIRRISRHRHVPKDIHHASKLKKTILQSRAQKVKNQRLHSAPGKVPFEVERKKNIVKIEK